MKHFVIYVPGLGDTRLYASAQRGTVALWRTATLQPLYFAANWADANEPYTAKLERLLAIIDDAATTGHDVSLVASSAGSSLALNAFSQRTHAVHAVVSVCGKLNNPQSVGDDLFDKNPAFKESLQAYQHTESHLSPDDRNKILIVRASRDNYVPSSDGEVTGAHTYRLPTIGHAVSIFMALTFFRRTLLRFIREA